MEIIDNPHSINDEFMLARNLNVPPQLVASGATLEPGIQFTSSQRNTMFTSNIIQALVVDGSEMPYFASGYEMEFAKYTFNQTRFDQDSLILAVIPKYKANIGEYPIKATPSYTVIYEGADGKIHSMESSTYFKGTDGFGYENKINLRKLSAGASIRKGETLSTSNNVDGMKYKLGLNANIAYMTMKETNNDAFVISRSLADRLESTGIRTLVLQIDRDMVPLNLYGDGDGEYKFFPDIGEQVRADGIMCALRKVNDCTVIADMTEKALATIQSHHDEAFYTEVYPATVIDVDVRINESKKVKTPSHVFNQLIKYQDQTQHYYETILDKYKEYCLSGYVPKEAGSTFTTLVTRASEYLLARGIQNKVFNFPRKNPPKFSRKTQEIPFIEIVLTYSFKYKVTQGFKITGREAGKGVVSKVLEDADMPVNDFGVKTDIIVAPETIPNRMNAGQLYEQFVNQCSWFIIQRIKNMDRLQAFEYVVEFLSDINPQYALLIRREAQDDKDKIDYINEILEDDAIIVVSPPFLNTYSPKWALFMADKYQIEDSPVEYNLRDSNGKLIRRVRTKASITIGKKYIYLLCKIPHSRSSGITYVNQYGLAIRLKHKKHSSPIGLTPIRIGEDEVRNIILSVGSDVAFRVLSLYANTPEAIELMTETLLTADRPTDIYRMDISNEELAKKNASIQVCKHLAHTIGFETHMVGDDEAIDDVDAFLERMGEVE